MRPDSHWLMSWYVAAKRTVVDAGHLDEIVWQANSNLEELSVEQFVREAAWVVLAAGMSDTVVRRVFPAFACEMREFEISLLMEQREAAREGALRVFGHAGKVDAILEIASRVAQFNETSLRLRLQDDAEQFLRGLPYVGPVTWRHLAKNIGVQVPKSDRHLVRLSELLGRYDVDILCTEIAEMVGDPVPVVDIVLWRWCVESGERSGVQLRYPRATGMLRESSIPS